MDKILLFGGSGMVGSRVSQLLSQKFQVVAPAHREVDLIDLKALAKYVIEVAPRKIIYAAGVASPDRAQEDPQLAYVLNAEAPKVICRVAAQLGVPVFYYSTDAVFDGRQSDRPYLEDDQPNPRSVYGQSKWQGEQNVLKSGGGNCVIRIIMVYSDSFESKRDFARMAVEKLARGEEFAGIKDQMVNPIYVDDVASATQVLLEHDASGIYHLGAIDPMSNLEFVKRLTGKFGFDERLVVEQLFEDFSKMKPLRCQYCWLDTSKFVRHFGNGILQTVDDSLEDFKAALKSPEVPV